MSKRLMWSLLALACALFWAGTGYVAVELVDWRSVLDGVLNGRQR